MEKRYFLTNDFGKISYQYSEKQQIFILHSLQKLLQINHKQCKNQNYKAYTRDG